ncbi:MAG: SPFH domain-containing protein [Acidiferrobacterales bacterium]|nr:SPFH domain-containing protein [Acidiferrobacterales bacterium]
MGLWDIITGQFIDVVEWMSDEEDVMVKRFDREDSEIKYGAMLTVRESQTAVFVNEGQIADVFPPGLYQLETANLPILTTLQSWPYGFKSPFKAEVYFLSTKQFIDLKWGTKNPIMMRDKEFGAVRLRGFGTYAIRIVDAAKFLKEVAGTDDYFTTDEITDQLRNLVVSRFAEITASAEIPVLDLAANYEDLGNFLRERINPEFAAYGLELTTLLVENISLPTEVEKALDKRTSMGVIGDLRKYTEYQAADALTKAADNPGGGGEAIAMGMGFAMANKLGATLNAPPDSPAPAGPPPVPEAPQYYIVVDGKRAGPYDPDEMIEQAQNGSLHRKSLVWRGGMRKWRVASELDEITEILDHIPPEIPA